MKLFLLIGQSNMAGRGLLGEVAEIENELIFMFRNNEFVPMKEPVHTDKPEFAGVGLCASFALEYVKKYNEKVGLIPCAVGGSSLDEWQKGEPFYENAVNCAKNAQEFGEIAGILWHQGEADCNNEEKINSYETRFITMLCNMKKSLNLGGIPVVLGELGGFLGLHNGNTLYKELNLVFLELTKKYNNFGLVSAKDLTDKGDTLHFNSLSLREFGKRYFEVFDKLGFKR